MAETKMSNIVTCILLLTSGHLFEASKTTRESYQSLRTPTNVRIRTADQMIELHWEAPTDINSASFCAVEYKTEAAVLSIKVPIDKERLEYRISDLERNTLYQIRLFCFYGDSIEGDTPTEWISASTRTVSAERNICPGTIPNAFLHNYCIRQPSAEFCDYSCVAGFKKSFVPAVLRGGLHHYHNVKCQNGTWVTQFESSGFRIQDICLLEALDEKCPKEIPNGELEEYCGHATDWLCDFQCNGGYNLSTHAEYGFQRHVLMGGKLKNFFNKPEKLFCDEGKWKTGYENLGLDVSGVCVHIDDHHCGGTQPTPNAVYSDESSYMYPNGVSTMTGCRRGYHHRALAQEDTPKCESKRWFLQTSKYDSSIIPETLCVSDATLETCNRSIPHGHIRFQSCRIDCDAFCSIKYRFHGSEMLTCEDGKWLTASKPYNGDNICSPRGGMPCSSYFPNGMVTGSTHDLKDVAGQRVYLNYTCNGGFRPHYGALSVECVAASNNMFLNMVANKLRDESRIPTDVIILTGEEWIQVQWNPPIDVASADFCMLEYKSVDVMLSIIIPFTKDTRKYIVSGLHNNTEYSLRLFCIYGNVRGPPTDWIITRTKIDPSGRCPHFIPNGVLEPNCGPATDWLCDFECNGGFNMFLRKPYGYSRHTIMYGYLKRRQNKQEKLFCENGAWKTGYEHLGVDVNNVCVNAEEYSCTKGLFPNAVYRDTSTYMYPHGISTMKRCKEGFHRHALAGSRQPYCQGNTWFVRGSKFDSRISPQTFCVPDETPNACPRNIPNGYVPNECVVDCSPVCNSGYHVHGGVDIFIEIQDHVTCEDGQWLTESPNYTGDNICFPDEGMRCQRDIPNGEVIDTDNELIDKDDERLYFRYRCYDGFRPHRGAREVECVAGKLVTWQERFGIDVSAICVRQNNN